MEAQSLAFGISTRNPVSPLSFRHSRTLSFPRFSSSPGSTGKWVARESHYLSNMVVSCATSHYKHLFNRKMCLPRACALNSDVADSQISVERKNLAVFVSGGGSNFKAIHEATLAGSVLGDVVALVTNKSSCGGANYAREKGIPVILYPKTKEETEELSSYDLVATLRRFEVDYILLAGYIKLIPTELVQAYPRRIVNIHPSLLPAFGGKGYYGMKVHKAVIASGARYSGPTVHIVDEHYDTGRILAQRVVPVLANDTVEELAARVLLQEHRLYAEVVAALCEDRVIYRDDGVPLIRRRDDPNKYS